MGVAKGKSSQVAELTAPLVAVVGDSTAAVEALESLILEDGFRLYAHGGQPGDVGLVAPDAIVMDVAEPKVAKWVEARLLQYRSQWGAPILCLFPLSDRLPAQAIAELGVDDYLLKPIRPLELGNRLRVMLQHSREMPGMPLVERRRRSRRREDRRTEVAVHPEHRCVIDEASKTVVLEGRRLELSPREYELFRLLFSCAGRILSAKEIIAHVWQDARRATASDVHQYMHLLRRKVEMDPDEPRWIITVRGFGYKLVFPSDD